MDVGRGYGMIAEKVERQELLRGRMALQVWWQREAEEGVEIEACALFAGAARTGDLDSQRCLSAVLQAGRPTAGCRQLGLS